MLNRALMLTPTTARLLTPVAMLTQKLQLTLQPMPVLNLLRQMQISLSTWTRQKALRRKPLLSLPLMWLNRLRLLTTLLRPLRVTSLLTPMLT
ncbi:hypothetical protein D3C86_1725650 [compost metagenome]